MSTKQSKNVTKQGKVDPKISINNKRRRRRSKQRRGRINPSSSLLVTNTIRHRELWTTLNFSTNSDGTGKKQDFDYTSFPPWFAKVAKLYEMYQLHYIRIFVKSPAATTTSGSYVLSYNTNYYQKSDSRTFAQMAAQQNAKQTKIYQDLSVVIPASALKNFRTNTPTDGSDSWAFNAEIGVLGNSVAVDLPVWIEYVVTVRNPQVWVETSNPSIPKTQMAQLTYEVDYDKTVHTAIIGDTDRFELGEDDDGDIALKTILYPGETLLYPADDVVKMKFFDGTPTITCPGASGVNNTVTPTGTVNSMVESYRNAVANAIDTAKAVVRNIKDGYDRIIDLTESVEAGYVAITLLQGYVAYVYNIIARRVQQNRSDEQVVVDEIDHYLTMDSAKSIVLPSNVIYPMGYAPIKTSTDGTYRAVSNYKTLCIMK